jgi:hypothetical protein
MSAQWVPVPRPRSPLQQIGDKHRGRIRHAARRAIVLGRRHIDSVMLRNAVQRGPHDLMLALQPALSTMKYHMRRVVEPIAEIHHRAKRLRKMRVLDSHKINVSDESTQYGTDRVGALIKDIDEKTRERIAELVDQSLEKGWQHQTLESKIRNMIGLSDRQVNAVEKLRSRLEDADSGETIKFGSNSVRVPREVSEEWISRQTEKYSDELVADRAEMIADTERSRAIHDGQRESWNAEGLPVETQRVWNAGSDFCPICGELDGQVTTLDGVYTTEDGEEYNGPPDPHPNCNCTEDLFVEDAEDNEQRAAHNRAAFNENHDEQGRFAPSDNSGESPFESLGVKLTNEISQPMSPKGVRDRVQHLLGDKGEAIVRDAVAIQKEIAPNGNVTIQAALGEIRVTTVQQMGKDAEGNRIKIEIQRNFSRQSDGTLVAYHSLFTLPVSEQGKGTGADMLAKSLDSYEKHGIDIVALQANIDVGGYAWARLGFRTSDPQQFENTVRNQMMGSGIPRGRAVEILSEMKKAGEDAPSYVASLPEGKKLLLESTWNGYLGLKTEWGKSTKDKIVERAKSKKSR